MPNLKRPEHSSKRLKIAARFVFTFYTICQNILGNSPAVTAIGNSVVSSYSENGSSSMSDERAISSSQSGGQDDFTESGTEAAFEDSAKYDQHKSSLQVTANKLENFWKTVEIKNLTIHIGPDNQLLQHAKEDKEKWLKKWKKQTTSLTRIMQK